MSKPLKDALESIEKGVPKIGCNYDPPTTSFKAFRAQLLDAERTILHDATESLDWMIQHLEFLNKTDTPDKEDSPELTKAKEALAGLRKMIEE